MTSRSSSCITLAARFSSYTNADRNIHRHSSTSTADQDDDQRREVDQEVVEAQPGAAGDDDVRRVTDQGGGAADVGGHRLGDQERDRRDPQPVAHQQGHRGHQQHRRHVVQQRRGHRGDHDQHHHHRERPPPRPLGRPDRQVLEHPGLLDDADDDHHPEQQEDDVPVDPGVLAEERRVRVHHAEQHHDRRAAQGCGHPVDPFGGDQHVRRDERREHQPGGQRPDPAPSRCSNSAETTTAPRTGNRP